jgi:tetrapyrrole methylase family protein/MazG family protein
MKKSSIWILGTHSEKAEIAQVAAAAGAVFSRGKAADRWLAAIGITNWDSLPAIHDQKDLSTVFNEKIAKIRTVLESGKDFVYVTAAMPLSSDLFVKEIIRQCKNETICWAGGQDLTLDNKIQPLICGSDSLTILDGFTLLGKHHFPVDPSQSAVIYYPDQGMPFDQIARLLKDIYPPTHEIGILSEKADGQLNWNIIQIDALSGVEGPVMAMVLPARAPDASLVSFEELIAYLRAPEGCPWDKKQTHDTLRKYLLEETYEALDALDQHDMEGLKEELGDIVLQIALHAQIATENHEFNMADILEGINRKIVYRHPHVFGDAAVDGVKGVLQNWEKLKEKERTEKGIEAEKGLLDGIPQSFPALAQAQTIQDRAARVGFDWSEIDPVMDKVLEEFDEVKTAPNEVERAKELGDLLFAVVNLVRWYKVDAESALRGTNQKFRRRFAYIEKNSHELQKPMQDMTLEEMDVYWNEAKKLE